MRAMLRKIERDYLPTLQSRTTAPPTSRHLRRGPRRRLRARGGARTRRPTRLITGASSKATRWRRRTRSLREEVKKRAHRLLDAARPRATGRRRVWRCWTRNQPRDGATASRDYDGGCARAGRTRTGTCPHGWRGGGGGCRAPLYFLFRSAVPRDLRVSRIMRAKVSKSTVARMARTMNSSRVPRSCARFSSCE